MDNSARLSLPYLLPSQAQKHVTHNTALERLDLLVQLVVEEFGATTPPTLPQEGQIWALGDTPTDEWAGEADRLAAWVGGAWLFITPAVGWVATDQTDQTLHVRGTTGWDSLLLADLDNLEGIGIGTSYDATNKLSVSSEATLLNHAGSGHQLKLNKAVPGDTASLLFQTGFSGRAEMGTAGSDGFDIKVSDDGATWHTGLTVAPDSGAVTAPNGMEITGTLSGTAVTQSATDTTAHRVLKTGDGGILGNSIVLGGTDALHERSLRGGQYIGAANTVGGLPEPAAFFHTIFLSRNANAGGIYTALSMRNTANPAAQKIWFGSGGGSESAISWTELWHKANTAVDANGFVKQASPIVRLHDDCVTEPVHPVGAVFEKLATGSYVLRDVEPLADEGWQIEVPQDANGNRLVFVTTSYDAKTRSLHVKTSKVAWKARWVAGKPIDIPDGRWIDLRFKKNADDEEELG